MYVTNRSLRSAVSVYKCIAMHYLETDVRKTAVVSFALVGLNHHCNTI